ncbi:MAG: CesT family type III secretion system chaperone [Candidatus Accumulibacter sp.]|jgi:hypothetical protein|nr:CesT family type III secretion system chaperone [Accumulibacter sp.]
MASRFDAAIAAICAESGWKPSAPDADGKVHFSLKEMEFTLAAPDDCHLCFLHPLVTPAPDEAPDVEAERLARMVVARERKAAILSFYEGTFYLHVMVDMAATRPQEIPAICQDFLNDCDWWRQNHSSFT